MKDKSNFTVEDFKKSVDAMIATSDSSYASDTSFKRVPDLVTYTKEEAQQIISTGEPEELKNLSVAFFHKYLYNEKRVLPASLQLNKRRK